LVGRRELSLATPEASLKATEIAERLGGLRVLGQIVESDFDLLEAIAGGLPIAAVETVIREGTFSAGEIHDLVLPRRTFSHRKKKAQTLTAVESDRLTRAVRLAGCAEEAIGNPEKAARWLREPNWSLHEKRPIELLESDVGARMVEQVLGRIEYGLGA
jgi:putative toxin-antitoxin system antitoxin component (TIGR02293 family)